MIRRGDDEDHGDDREPKFGRLRQQERDSTRRKGFVSAGNID